MLFDWKSFFTSLLEICIQNKEVLFGICVALFILSMLRFFKRKNMLVKTSSNELGELFVSRQAITNIILGKRSEIESWGKIKKISLLNKKHSLEVKLWFLLNSKQSFDKISIQIQSVIQKTILECLGGAKTVHVHVILDGILKEMEENTEV